MQKFIGLRREAKGYMRAVRQYISRISMMVFILSFLSGAILYSQGPLKAEFYSGKNFEKYVSTKSMENIDLYWERTPPVPNMDPQKCSIRWTGSIKPPVSGEYKFSAKVDYGLRLWIDGELIIDDWTLHDWGRLDGRIALDEHVLYDFKVEYFNALFGGEIRLMWDVPIKGNSNNVRAKAAIVDSKYFFPTKAISTEVASISNDIEVNNSDPIPTKKPEQKKKQKERNVTSESPSEHASSRFEIATKEEVKAKERPTAIAKEYMTTEVIEKFKPKSVQFERAKAVILENSFSELDELAIFLKLNNYLFAQIEGHTDLAGDPDKNMRLSERRAYAVARYLIKKGVDASQIDARGMGGTQPLIRSVGKLYHPENRRVSFNIKVL